MLPRILVLLQLLPAVLGRPSAIKSSGSKPTDTLTPRDHEGATTLYPRHSPSDSTWSNNPYLRLRKEDPNHDREEVVPRAADLPPPSTPLPTSGSTLLALRDGQTTYDLNFLWNMSCATTIMADYTNQSLEVGDVTMAEMWSDIATSPDNVARDILKKEMQEVIEYFNIVSGALLGMGLSDFTSPGAADTIQTERRGLSSAWAKLKHIFYQEGNISWLLAVIPTFGGIGYSIQRVSTINAHDDPPVQNLSVIGIGLASILIKSAVGQIYDRTGILQASDRFILRLLSGSIIKSLLRTIFITVMRRRIQLPLQMPPADEAAKAMQLWQEGAAGDIDGGSGIPRTDLDSYDGCGV